jgi:hypothetical protein
VSEKDVKSSKHNGFSPFFFASPLCCNERERAMAAAGQNSVSGLRYHGSRVGPENCNLIERMVCRRSEKIVNTQSFLALLLALLLLFNKRERKAAAAGRKLVCGRRFHNRALAPNTMI